MLYVFGMNTNDTAAATLLDTLLAPAVDLDALCEGHKVSDVRRERLAEAIRLGASEAVLVTLRDANRTSTTTTITLPEGRYSHCSRAKGWCRKGRGTSAEWGERVDGGYRVGPGKWLVCSSDGFRREERLEWLVREVQVGTATWLVAD